MLYFVWACVFVCVYSCAVPTLELCKYFIITVKFNDDYIYNDNYTHIYINTPHTHTYKHPAVYRHFTENALSAQRNKKKN